MGILLSMVLAASTTLLPLVHAVDWLGHAPAAQSFAGKVVVVDVFTFDCINCKHVVPELRSLRKRFPQSDLVIVGIHSPETPFERGRAGVIQNLSAQGITWPVAIDNSFALWKADRSGSLRKTVIGEGQDATIDSTVRELLGQR